MQIKPKALCLCIEPELRDGPQEVEIVRFIPKGEVDNDGCVAREDLWEFTPALPMPSGYFPLDDSPARYLIPLSDPDQSVTKEERKPVEIFSY